MNSAEEMSGERDSNEYTVGESSIRPWGRWEVLVVGDGIAIKTISVNPGHLLSLQLHHYRSEHWIILSGMAEITIGEEVGTFSANDVVFIPANTLHRIVNVGEDVLIFIEIQSGSILLETDIERFDDRYGREN